MLDIGRLIRTGLCRKLPAGQQITFLSGGRDPQREMYVMVAGKVDVFKEEPKGVHFPVGSLLPGDVFGGGRFFHGSDAYTYTAEIDSIAYIISEQSFENLAVTQPGVMLEVLRAAYAPMRAYYSGAEAAITADTAPDADEQSGEDGIGDAPARSAPVRSAPEAIVPDLFPAGHRGYPGITKPGYAAVTFKKEYTCPYCGKQFTGRKISTSKLFQAEPARFDLRKYYRDFQPEWYEVVTCPHCYFSMYYTYFLEQKRLDKGRLESSLNAARASVMLDFDAERDLDFVFTSHYLALACAPGYTASVNQIGAKIWGNLSWLYEDAGDEDMMKLAAERAAESYEKVYMESSLTPVKEQVSCLSIAGMLYRAGRLSDANLKKYLYRAKTINSGNKVYAGLADELMDMLRES